MSGPLIHVDNVSRIYGKGEARVAALDGVSFKIRAGEFVAIIGASGSGKTTLMNLLGALDKPTEGSVEIAGFKIKPNTRTKSENIFFRMVQSILLAFLDVATGVIWFIKNLITRGGVKIEPEADFRNNVVGFVFQQFQLMPRKSALKNVMMPLGFRRPRFSNEKERAIKCLNDVGLADRMGHKPTQLSGGQQQRVAIARALVGEPEILLADEPTGALDTTTSTEIMALLHKLNAEGITIILITHDHEVAAAARRVITMRDGKIISDAEQEIAA